MGLDSGRRRRLCYLDMRRARRPRPRALWALIALAVLAAGCQREDPSAVASQKPAATAPKAARPRGPAGTSTPRPVRLVPAAEVQVARTGVANGTLAADEQLVLGTKVVGRLAEISVDLGSAVRKGQPVARIDVKDYQYRLDQVVAALQQARVRLGLPADGSDDRVDPTQTAVVRQAKALLDQAQLQRDRLARLVEQQLVARAELDAAISSLQVAEGRYQDAIEEVRNRQAILVQRRSELEIARQQLADTAIVSPMEGAVSERQASVGQYLAAGTPVATLVRVDPLRLRLTVPEREAKSVRAGQAVELTVEGDLSQYTGRVARLSPAIAESNRTLLVEAEVSNPRGILRPGSFAKAEIIAELDQSIIMVPADALVVFAGIEKVLTVADGRAVEKRVRTGRRFGEGVEITEGIAAGEPVIVQPGNLVGGQAVKVVR